MHAFWTPLASQNFFWTWMSELKICIILWSGCRTLVFLINSNCNAFTYWTSQLQSLQSWQVREVLYSKTMSVCYNHGTGGRQMKYTEHRWDDNDGGKWIKEKLVPLVPTQIPYRQNWDRTWPPWWDLRYWKSYYVLNLLKNGTMPYSKPLTENYK